MSLNERQQKILDLAQIQGELKIADLKQMFPVTEMTIRRDLEKLEELGGVRRTFGGIVWIGKDIALHERSITMIEEKLRIGRKACSLIRQGESVFMDGGTTTLQVAKSLETGKDITVVTNALNIANELQYKKIQVILIGGSLRSSTSSMVGSIAIEQVSRMGFDRSFLGASGLTAEHGFSNTNMDEAELKRLVIRQSSEACIVMDHGKFGRKALFSFAEPSALSRLITSQHPEDELREACESAGLDIVVA